MKHADYTLEQGIQTERMASQQGEIESLRAQLAAAESTRKRRSSERKQAMYDSDAEGEEEGTHDQPPVIRRRTESLYDSGRNAHPDAKPPKPATFEGAGRANVDVWLFEVEQ